MSSVVPEGWSKLMLGNIGTFSTSSVDKKSKGEETLVSLLNYMDIYRNSVLSSSYPFQSVTAPAKQVTSSSVRNGDVFFTPSSETPDDIGHSAVFIGDAENLVHSYHTIRFRPAANNHFDDNYKAFAFKGEETYEYFRKRATGSTRFTVSLPIFNELEVLCPPLPEQKKIASILTSVDEVIENTQKQIDKLQDLKKATMNELLTKGIGHTEFKDSELGRIPKSWEVTQFANILDIIAGKGFELKEYSTEGVKLLRIDNVSWGKISWDSCAFLPYEYLESEKKLILAEHDLLLALNRPITQGKLKLARCTASDVPAILYQRVGKITSISEDICTNNFAFYLLNQYLPDFIKGESVGSDQPFINLTALRGLMLPLPSRCEQDRMYESMNAIDIGIDRLTTKLCQTQSLKKSLMQDLLTGKVRVTVN